MALITNESAFAHVTGELLHDDVEYGKIQSISMHVCSHSVYFFFYDRIIKLWCILEASLLIEGSSYSRSFQRTFQKHDTSMASISCSLSMKRSRSLLCMAKQSASHINTPSTIPNSPSATIHRLNFDRPTCLRHRHVVGCHIIHTETHRKPGAALLTKHLRYT